MEPRFWIGSKLASGLPTPLTTSTPPVAPNGVRAHNAETPSHGLRLRAHHDPGLRPRTVSRRLRRYLRGNELKAQRPSNTGKVSIYQPPKLGHVLSHEPASTTPAAHTRLLQLSNPWIRTLRPIILGFRRHAQQSRRRPPPVWLGFPYS